MSGPAASGLRGKQPLKLGIFCLNISGGASMSKANSGKLTWEFNVRLAQEADRAGWDFLLPLGRWRGLGGEINPNGKQFEGLTWAAGISAVTSQITVLSTVHVPLVHPLFIAKQAATIDHIGGGRFGMNIVAGWNGGEFAMFGIEQRPHDERYDAADEWLTVMERLWDEGAEPAFEGDYYKLSDGYLEPKPIQQPRPLIISAGQSPRGLEFALKRADFIFTGGANIDELRERCHKTLELRTSLGSSTRIVTHAPVVLADSESEAKRYFEWYVEEMGDFAAAAHLARAMIAGGNQSVEIPEAKLHAFSRAMISGWAGMPLVGTAEQVAEDLVTMQKMGVEGVALSWVDYENGLRQFNEQVLPLLEQAGIRL
jgi:alkanesulfonate monooxygenase SsuD/methylene tetrahydromethanopterin reductase-like flavin-dependent oxidoreductase (luciferase family)